TVLLSAFRLGGLRGDEDEDDEGQQRSDEDEEQRKNRRALRLATLVPAIGSVVAFILTEDMSLPMQFIDRWTPLMVAILVAQAVLTVLARNKDEEQDEQQDEQQATA
ncbi:MAG: hypothetical protein IJG82_04995, partial [Atopobiaceae bacterium]|nr:hypothetical protein [Atopobiaceae bacterium]